MKKKDYNSQYPILESWRPIHFNVHTSKRRSSIENLMTLTLIGINITELPEIHRKQKYKISKNILHTIASYS